MGSQAQVIVVAVELSGMAAAGNVLIHGLQLKVAVFEKVVESYSRHIEHTVLAGAVTVEEVVAERRLEPGCQEIASLQVATQEIVALVNLLPFGESHVEPIGLGSQVEAMVQPGELQPYAAVVGALILTLHIDRSREAKEQLILLQAVRTTLRRGHHPFRHVGDTPGIEQGGDVPIIAEGLRRGIDVDARPVEDAELISPTPTQQAMELYT